MGEPKLGCFQLLPVTKWYLQHLVRTGLDARHHVGRREGHLLHLSKVVLGIAVHGETPNGNEGELTMRPNLQQIHPR